jgi:hypothetical protein
MPLLKTILTNKNLFLFGLFLVVVGMPMSRFLASFGQFLLLGNWIIEGDFKRKWQVIKTSKVLWVLSSFYFLHLVGLFYTSDFNYALNDLRIKLPLLWFPLLFATSRTLNKKEVDGFLYFFIASVFLASMVSMTVLLGFTNKKITDIRDISLFNSHIRFALMIVLSISILLVYYFRSKKLWEYIIKTILIAWLILFLFILESLTGVIILSVILFYIFVRYMGTRKSLILKYFPFIFLFAGGAILFYLVKTEWDKYYTKRAFDKVLVTKTLSGNEYYNDTRSKVTENGYYVWIYNQYDEMQREWNKRSKMKFESSDKKGNPVSFTLIRYLTSKGLKKDSASVSMLKPEEIERIEKGVSNYLYPKVGDMRSRIHEVIWEYDNYINGINPSGHSVLMRLEFWKTGISIIQNHPLFGVGTGDVQLAYNTQYKEDNSKLNEKWRLRSHNQFMAITIAFGLFGLIVFLCWLFVPVFLIKEKHSLFGLFFLISLISMLNEDTLETQAGVAFYGFFYSFFIFNGNEKREQLTEMKGKLS